MRISDWSSDVCSSDLWPCSRKPSFLTILPAGHDRNAFLRPAACQNCSGNPLSKSVCRRRVWRTHWQRSEEHTSELQSLMRNSYAVICLKKKKKTKCKGNNQHPHTKPPSAHHTTTHY